MDYIKIYNKITDNGKDRLLTGYTETHHIIPKCMGGTNDSWNLVKLTAKEHFICHLLLCEIYPKNRKLKMALWNMSNVSRVYQERYKVSGKLYEIIRKEYSESVSGQNNPRYGVKLTDETKQKISNSRIGKYGGDKNPFFGKTHTDETKDKLRISSSENKHSEETKKKMSLTRKGKPSGRKGKVNSEEHRKKIKESLKKVGHPKPSSKKCSINGLTFNSAVEASKHFNMPDSSVRDRIRNKNFPTWIWLE
jgi:hypothetical protein